MRIILAFTFALALVAQTTSTPVSVPTPTVNVAALPSITAGAGTSWNRGNAYPYTVDNTIALHIGSSQWYSWTEIQRPVTTTQAGAQPLPSSLTTGGAWIAAQTPTGSMFLTVIVQAGFTTTQATSTTAPAFSGSFGIGFHPWKKPIYLLAYVKGANAVAASGNSLATFTAQPGFQVMYGFGAK